MGSFKILLYEEMHEAGKALLREKAEVFFASSFEEASLIKEAKEMDGLIIRANGKVSRKLMESAPKLKVIGRHGVGVETIDLEAATEKGIWVVNTPDANDISVAEHFFGLALMLSKMLKRGRSPCARDAGKPAINTLATNFMGRPWASWGLAGLEGQ